MNKSFGNNLCVFPVSNADVYNGLWFQLVLSLKIDYCCLKREKKDYTECQNVKYEFKTFSSKTKNLKAKACLVKNFNYN